MKIKLLITGINIELNTNDKVAFITESSEQNNKGVYQMAEGQMANIAKSAGIPNLQLLNDSFFAGFNNFEDSYLHADAKEVAEGDPVIRNGQEVIDPDTGDAMLYTKAHWVFDNWSIELSESAALYVESIKKTVQTTLLMEDVREEAKARKERAARKRRARNTNTNTDAPEENSEGTEEDL